MLFCRVWRLDLGSIIRGVGTKQCVCLLFLYLLHGASFDVWMCYPVLFHQSIRSSSLNYLLQPDSFQLCVEGKVKSKHGPSVRPSHTWQHPAVLG